MTAHLTEAEARKLGLIDEPAKVKTTARAVRNKDCLPNRCCTCDEVFTTEAGERRHSDGLGHNRFEAVTT